MGPKAATDNGVKENMKKKHKIEIVIIAFILLGIAFFIDLQGRKTVSTTIHKRETGEGSTQMELVVSSSSINEKMEYELEVGEKVITEQEAFELFQQAKEEVDATVYYENENANEVKTGLRIKEYYVDKKVRASWVFDNDEYISYDGEIDASKIGETGLIISAEVTFQVQKYQKIYQFSFRVSEPERNEKEQLLYDISKEIQENENDTELILPTEVDGVTLEWHQKQEGLFGKILFLELVTLGLVVVAYCKKESQNKERERTLMEFDYSEIVGKFAILLGAGMSVKQAWYSVTASYLRKRKLGKNKRRIYEEMAKTYYELQDGQYEVEAYLDFGRRVNLSSYNRFIRLLNQTNSKGAKGVSLLLQAEATTAFTKRVAMAKKLGEEASTKLLFPLILMMMVLFAIIIAPAAIEFIR